MKTRTRQLNFVWLLAAAFAWPVTSVAQVPVDEDGNPIAQVETSPAAGSEELPVLSATELEELIGPVALYPDDLLAIILPASTYPLQIVQAARFLEDLETDSSLKPDEDWDDSVVALTNYPEVVEMMSEDLDWTWRLGEAVVAQQTDVIKAIESFRDRAYAAGNLKSDDFQNVTEEDGTIHITPVEEDVIYVPYYEPERVVVYQPRPVYYYYPRSYPVYYYPYPAGYAFNYGYFWGVTTAFSIGWYTDHLHVWHHSYRGHPYYGRSYYNYWWYRRPDIHIHNNYYGHNRYNRNYDRYRRGDYWQPHTRRTVRSSDQRLTRTRYYPGTNTSRNAGTSSRTRNANDARVSRTDGGFTSPKYRSRHDVGQDTRQEIRFRERSGTATASRNSADSRQLTERSATRQRQSNMTGSSTSRRTRDRTTVLPTAQARNSLAAPSRSRESTRTVSRPTGSPSIRPTSQRRASTARQSTSPSRQVIRPQNRQPSNAGFSRPSEPRRSSSGPSQSRPSPSGTSQRQSAQPRRGNSNAGSASSSKRNSGSSGRRSEKRR